MSQNKVKSANRVGFVSYANNKLYSDKGIDYNQLDQFYTKEELATSGSSEVSWDNITDIPGSIISGGTIIASDVDNDSLVSGSSVKDALETLIDRDAMIITALTSGYQNGDISVSGALQSSLNMTMLPGTDEFYVDGTLGDDTVAALNPSKPFKTIQACLNYLGQPITKSDYERHITIYIASYRSSLPGSSPPSWNGVYEENLVIPNRNITMIGKGVKIGNNTGSGFGNILKEYSTSRRFGGGSSDFRPCLTLIGLMNVRDTHNRLRNGIHIGGACRTSILKRNLDSIQGNGSNQITVHVAPGQFIYPITVPTTYPTEPYIRINVSGTTNYNGNYDITAKINDTTFTATRVSGTNANTNIETSGSFFESDSAGASGLSHDAAFVNCYMQGAYTCDDGTVNGAAPTAGTEVLYAVGSRFFTGIEGRTILAQRWENSTLAGTSVINSIAGMNNCSFAGSITTSTFTYSTDDMGFMNCRFNSAVPITVNTAGQTVRMDSTTFISFLKTGCTWVTNTPTIDILGGILSGTTANRPTVRPIGFPYFDTTLNKDVWWNGTTWIEGAIQSYVDAQDATISGLINQRLAVSGGTMTGVLVLSGDPSTSGQAANKHYVDAAISGVGGGGGSGLVVTDYSQTLTFSGDTFKTFDLSVSGNTPDIVYGKMYFDPALSGNFSDTIRIEFYSTTNRIDNELIYVSEIPMAYSTLSGTATSGNSSIALNSSIGFAANNLIYLMNPNAEFRRVTSVTTGNILNLKNNLDNGHSIGTGVSKVGEIGSLMLFDSSSNKKIYGKVIFSTPQTCSINFNMKVRS